MGKVIFGLLIAAIVWLLFFARRKSTLNQSSKQSGVHSRSEQNAERMVTCARCGVNIPESEATTSKDGSHTCQNVGDCGSKSR